MDRLSNLSALSTLVILEAMSVQNTVKSSPRISPEKGIDITVIAPSENDSCEENQT
jgi:hypothetical protein